MTMKLRVMYMQGKTRNKIITDQLQETFEQLETKNQLPHLINLMEETQAKQRLRSISTRKLSVMEDKDKVNYIPK